MGEKSCRSSYASSPGFPARQEDVVAAVKESDSLRSFEPALEEMTVNLRNKRAIFRLRARAGKQIRVVSPDGGGGSGGFLFPLLLIGRKSVVLR